jgi:hypothetical protein
MPLAMTTRVSRRAPRQGALGQTFRAANSVVSSRRADTTVLLDSSRGVCYSLNELGWRIWDQIGTGRTVAEIVRTLRQEYDVPSDSFEADVIAFVDHLVSALLIEPADG